MTVKPTMFSSINDNKNLVTRDSTPSTTYFPKPVGSHSSRTSNQEEATARRNSDSTAPVSLRMISMSAEHKLGSQLDVSNGSRYELDRTSSQPSRQRLPDVFSQPPPDSYFQSPITKRLVEVNRNERYFAAAHNVGYTYDIPTMNRYGRNIKNEDVSTSSMVDRRLLEIPRVVQPIHLNEVRRLRMNAIQSSTRNPLRATSELDQIFDCQESEA